LSTCWELLQGLEFDIVKSSFAEDLEKDTRKPYEYVMHTASEKARQVFLDQSQDSISSSSASAAAAAATSTTTDAKSEDASHLIVIGCDTVVVRDVVDTGDVTGPDMTLCHIMEKPESKQHAFEMLKQLSGKEHSVFTGVSIIVSCDPKQTAADTDSLRTQVAGVVENDIQNAIEWQFYEETRVQFAELSDEMIQEYVESGEPMDKAGGYGIQGLGGTLISGINGCYFNVVGLPLHGMAVQLTKNIPLFLK
jgi:putative bifunctional nucleoside triphosphate pyrophosphatase / methyltransferase